MKPALFSYLLKGSSEAAIKSSSIWLSQWISSNQRPENMGFRWMKLQSCFFL